MRKRRSYMNEMGDDMDVHVGDVNYIVLRDRPTPGFKSNPIGFGADMSQHPKYKKPTRKR